MDFDLGHLKIGKPSAQPMLAPDDDIEFDLEMERGQLELARLEIRNAQLRRVLASPRSIYGYAK